jgi:ubiquinone/menaquinone biosynthesis C-methylase UbiE
MPGLSFIKGTITALPFKDGEVTSLSSICVIEHIGLGRYGDPLDQFGTEKSASELSRVLSPEGSLYISVPVDSESKTYFNAHRAFTRDHILSLFKDLKLVEETYIYGHGTTHIYERDRGFGTGLYHFKK